MRIMLSLLSQMVEHRTWNLSVRSWRPNQEHQTFSVVNDTRQMLSMVINKLPLKAKSL